MSKRQMIKTLLEAYDYAIAEGEGEQIQIWMNRVASALVGAGMLDEHKAWIEALEHAHFYTSEFSVEPSLVAHAESMKAILLGILGKLDQVEPSDEPTPVEANRFNRREVMGKSKPQFTETVICSHCGNKARMEVVAIYEQVQSHEMELGVGEMDWEAGRIWQLALCPACSGIILREFDYHTGMEPGTGIVDRRVLYPPVDKSLIGLPPEVDKAYQAALKVRQIDSNAFAVLLGRVLDRMCLDRGASGRSLYNRLISLAEKGEFPTRLAEMAHQLRQLRNIGAHADLGDLTPAEVPFLDDLCRAILEYVYTAPKLIEQVELRLQELEKNNSDIDKNGG